MSVDAAALSEVLRSPDEVRACMRSHAPARVEGRLLLSSPELYGVDWPTFVARSRPWTLAPEPNYIDNLLERTRSFLRTGDESELAEFGANREVPCSIEDYVGEMSTRPQQTMPAVEQRPSPALLDALGERGPLLGELAADEPETTYAYLAGAGHASDLHFDRDGRHVFNLQLVGRKRFVLFGPEAGPLLNPIMQFSALRARAWTDTQRADFVAYAGGVEVVLEPGEALYMPPFFWHHVEYLDAAAGVGFRVCPPSAQLQRVLDRIPANYLLAMLAGHCLAHPEDPQVRACCEQLEDLVARPVKSARGYYDAVRSTLRAQLLELGLDPDPAGSAIIDSLDYAAPMLARFMQGYVEERGGEDQLRLAPGVSLQPFDDRQVKITRSGSSVAIPIALGRALLGLGAGLTLAQLRAEHPEVPARAWARLDKLHGLGFVVSDCQSVDAA